MYKPYILLGFLAVATGIVGLVPFLHFLVFWFQDESGGRVRSFMLGAAMTVTSLLNASLLVAAGLQRMDRVLIEDTLERTKALQYDEASREEVMLGHGSREGATYAHDDATSGGERAVHGGESRDEGGAHDDGCDATRRGETRPAPGGTVQFKPGGNARRAPGGSI